MDIFDKRDVVLDRQVAMLKEEMEKDEKFLSLIKFENACCNSGFSGFFQDFTRQDLEYVDEFSKQNGFTVINDVISIAYKHIDQYGNSFIDHLSESEFEKLSKYDDVFFELQDQYTAEIYDDYIQER